MRNFVLGLAVAAAALLARPALAQLKDENLLAGVPEGFTLGYNAAQDGAEIYEFIPEGESVEDWTAMVTIQIFHGLADLPPDAFGAQLAEGWKGACPDSTVSKLVEDQVNGFPYSLWAFTCATNPQTGKPETMWFKGISGSDAYYSVQYAYRLPPDDDRETVALTYLVSASACDTRKPERPCPAGM